MIAAKTTQPLPNSGASNRSTGARNQLLGRSSDPQSTEGDVEATESADSPLFEDVPLLFALWVPFALAFAGWFGLSTIFVWK